MVNFPYKHIMWDWNGTLLNDSWLSVKIINTVLEKRHMETLDHDRYVSIFGFPVSDYYRRLGFDFVEESFEMIGTEFINGYEKHKYEVDLHPGVKEVLLKLRSLRVGHSILSAYKQNTLDELVAYFGIEKMFDKIIGLDNHFAESKVDNGIRWMKELGREASEVLFVGDTEHDYEVAEAIGVDCILIPGGHQTRAVLERTGSTIIDRIEDILLISAKTGERAKII
ncbi:MAG: HAD family hydrolase [Candidatus Marinimicrobia bacterium]|nr:HAD family hydrolase [Candidatus Neomarinimicrobiota bacterium]MCF7921578.1 HAD family hydrolase [Candidatus Neomarinimicrobiota bacterium]